MDYLKSFFEEDVIECPDCGNLCKKEWDICPGCGAKVSGFYIPKEKKELFHHKKKYSSENKKKVLKKQDSSPDETSDISASRSAEVSIETITNASHKNATLISPVPFWVFCAGFMAAGLPLYAYFCMKADISNILLAIFIIGVSVTLISVKTFFNYWFVRIFGHKTSGILLVRSHSAEISFTSVDRIYCEDTDTVYSIHMYGSFKGHTGSSNQPVKLCLSKDKLVVL